MQENYHDSSMITSSTYDETTKVMTVEFKNGTEYEYTGVEPDEYSNFIDASSQGKYFLENIKGKYAYSKK